MFESNRQSSAARRSFLSRLGSGVAGFGAVLAGGSSIAQAQSAGNSGWQPARHEQDTWLDQGAAQHRFIVDTTTAAGLDDGMLFANNYFIANQSGYGLKDSDLAVVIVLRHRSTAFGYNDAIWAKYGTAISQRINFTDPNTKRPPVVNVYKSGANAPLDNLSKRGVHFAVCQMATRRMAGAIAESTGGNADAIYTELAANLISNAHLVPAGIVAVNRAQERGYSFAYAG